MTHQPYGQGPVHPQYPAGGGRPGPQYRYGPELPGPAAPFPVGRPNPLATWSVVFAFVFAPAGAILGHLALSQIRQRFQPGRDRAIIGLTLSYTFIVLTVVVLALWGVTATRPSTIIAIPQTTQSGPGSSPGIQGPPPRASRPDLSHVLLAPREVRDIMGNPDLRSASGGSGGGADSDARADPAECAGTVIAGLGTAYADAGDHRKLNLSDPDSVMLVDQFVASFADPARARRFVAETTGQWQACAGQKLTLSASGLTALTWKIGDPVQRPPMTTLVNTFLGAKPLPYHRILAAKDNVVIDVSVFALHLSDEPMTIAERMLARIRG